MIVTKKILKDFLEPYPKRAMYLRSVEEEYPFIRGEFFIPHSCYVKEHISSGHFNLTDLTICFNQLIYTGFANALKYNKILGLEKINYEAFKKNKLNGLICKANNIEFKQPIESKNFSGNIEIKRTLLLKNTYFIKTIFDFEDKVNGEIMLAMKIISNYSSSDYQKQTPSLSLDFQCLLDYT
jgi:hypothetical protein